MSGEPDPVALDPSYASPGPSRQVAYTEATGTPVLSTGAPPGWQGAETPGFDRTASGAVELLFSRRAAIALRFGTEDALREAEAALHTRHGDAFGGSATQWPEVLADLHWLNSIVRSSSAATAAMIDFDWSAMEALARMLDVPPSSP